jgi:hypothetical protein
VPMLALVIWVYVTLLMVAPVVVAIPDDLLGLEDLSKIRPVTRRRLDWLRESGSCAPTGWGSGASSSASQSSMRCSLWRGSDGRPGRVDAHQRVGELGHGTPQRGWSAMSVTLSGSASVKHIHRRCSFRARVHVTARRHALHRSPGDRAAQR